GGERQPGQHMRPGENRGDNPAAMRTWYVPDGVETGPSGHRNADGFKPRSPGGPRPSGGRPGGPRPAGGPGQGPRRGGPGAPAGARGPGGSPRSPYGSRGASGDAAPSRPKYPFGHPGNAPSFPSDHANPG